MSSETYKIPLEAEEIKKRISYIDTGGSIFAAINNALARSSIWNYIEGTSMPSNIASALALANADTVTSEIYFPKGNYPLTTTFTFTSEKRLIFAKDAIITENGTIEGYKTQIDAGLYKIFDTNITLAGTWRVDVIRPEWWGVLSGGTDITVAFQKAIDFINLNIIQYTASGYGVGDRGYAFPKIEMSNGEYCTSETLNVSTLLNIECKGQIIMRGIGMTNKYAFTNGAGYQDNNPCKIVTMQNFVFYGYLGACDFDNNNEQCSKLIFRGFEAHGLPEVFKIDVQSSYFEIDEFKFDKCRHIINGNCDNGVIKNGWIEQGFLEESGDGTFVITGGSWEAHSVIGVPANPALRPALLGGPLYNVKERAWFNMLGGHLKIHHWHGGGEVGGATLVNYKVPYQKQGQAFDLYPNVLDVEISQGQQSFRHDLNPNETEDSNTCSIRLWTLPQIFIYKNNFGANASRHIIGVSDDIVDKNDLYGDYLAAGNNVTYSMFWDIQNNSSRLLVPGRNYYGDASYHPYIAEFVNMKPNELCRYDTTSLEYTYNSSPSTIFIDMKAPRWNFDLLQWEYITGLYKVIYNVGEYGSSRRGYFEYMFTVSITYHPVLNPNQDTKIFISDTKTEIIPNSDNANSGKLDRIVFIDSQGNESTTFNGSTTIGMRLVINMTNCLEPTLFNMKIERQIH